ncbi:MAG TPA: SDR family oxidoreductase [Gammaproteobacteria bacterium]
MATSHARKMKPNLQKLNEQVIVITGATSGIGLATARMAAKRGARLVLAARDEAAVRQLAEELNAAGCEAVAVTADVSHEDDVQAIVEAARERFGGFDTWVNNAAVSMYGHLLDEPIKDERQLFETNYWGTVHGSRAAAMHLRDKGGAIINVGSANSDYAAPLQGTFSASKHAVKGYTDALRMELEEEGAPVSVTLVKPSPIDTPYAHHARNHLENEPRQTPPMYSPEIAAKAILFCAEHPKRDIYIGGAGRLFSLAGHVAPRLMDRIMSRAGTRMQKTGRPDDGRDSLYSPDSDMQERGEQQGRVMKTSLYTSAAMHPKRTGVLIVASGVVAGLLWRAYRNNGRNGHAHLDGLAHESSKAKRSLKKASHLLEHEGKHFAHTLPKLGRKARHAIERNLPRH